jgi:hypothetical protein
MTIFDYLNDLQTGKNASLPVEEYNPYMIGRWLSFYDEKTLLKINNCLNHFNLNLDKKYHYMLASTIIPKRRSSKRILYIKKNTDNKNKEQNNRKKILAQNLEISLKELDSLLEYQQNLT